MPPPNPDAPPRACAGCRGAPTSCCSSPKSAGTPVGTVTLVVVPNLTHNARPWIQLENMVVDHSARRAGVGRDLLDAAVAFAHETNAYTIQLQSGEHRREAHAFYASMGFQPSSLGFRRYFE